MRIIDYRIVASQTDTGLTAEVQRLIREDWEPQGGPIQVVASAGALGQQTLFLAQAMVKRGETLPGLSGSLLAN